MNMVPSPESSLQDAKIDTKIKLAALWAALMFCYVYGDYFELYVPGKLRGMLEGRMEPLGPVTQVMLFGTSLMLAIPGVMPFLSLVMRPGINRWVNITLGAFYTGIVLLAIQGGWMFYKFFGIVEIGLSLAIIWYAWKWPSNV